MTFTKAKTAVKPNSERERLAFEIKSQIRRLDNVVCSATTRDVQAESVTGTSAENCRQNCQQIIQPQVLNSA